MEVRTVSGARAWPEAIRWSAEVIAPDGTRLYRVEREVPFDFPFPALVPAGNGFAVLLDAAQGLVEFLDRRGAVLRTWRPFLSPEPSYERIIKCSAGNDRAAFILSEPGGSEIRVVVTDLAGLRVRESAIPGTTAGAVLLAADGSALLASATVDGDSIRHITRLLDEAGQTLLEIPLLFRTGVIMPAEGRFVFADRYQIVGGSLAGGRVEFQVGLASGSRVITALECGRDLALAVTEEIDVSSGTPAYRDAEVIVLKRDGAVVERTRFESVSGSPSTLERESGDVVVRTGARTARIRDVL